MNFITVYVTFDDELLLCDKCKRRIQRESAYIWNYRENQTSTAKVSCKKCFNIMQIHEDIDSLVGVLGQ